MLFTPDLSPIYPPAVTILALVIVGILMAGAATLHNRHLRTADGPVEYEVVIGVLYTLSGIGLVYWPAAAICAVGFVVTGGLMLWGARLREDERKRKHHADLRQANEAAAEVLRRALIERTDRDA